MDVFQNVVFLSGTAPTRIADVALRKVGFRGLERPGLAANNDMTTLSASSVMKSQPTKMYDLVTEVPLEHVYKEVRSVADPYGETFRLLKTLFACVPNAKAIVVLGARQKVVELADEWDSAFRAVWAHAIFAAHRHPSSSSEISIPEGCGTAVQSDRNVYEEQKDSEQGGGRHIDCETLLLRRVLLDYERYENHLEGMGPLRTGPVGYLLDASKDKHTLQRDVNGNYLRLSCY